MKSALVPFHLSVTYPNDFSFYFRIEKVNILTKFIKVIFRLSYIYYSHFKTMSRRDEK